MMYSRSSCESFAESALVFLAQHPERTVRLIDAKMNLGGQRTWIFHESDVSTEALEFFKPMISRTWNEATVQFPRSERKLNGPFHVVRSIDFNRAVKDMLGDEVRLGVLGQSGRSSSRVYGGGPALP